ncbi:Uu.00g073890.m01.CDS01 [Anthostomella pinea]|uniref:Uu.00g073890.m01.CDS01 n=1 Tax=Anthostomella pinea TaxID=933095 RepID=A0AAI8YNV8_9PEZI|nr:Uu.00g073890.m01.CDS01 [Anthostomella pinea]
MAMFLSPLLPLLALTAFFGTIYYVWYRVFSYQGIPDSLAFATSDGSFLSRGRASLRSVFGVDALLWAGHRDFSKKGRPYILPDVFTGHQVIIPSEHLPWLMKQPASVLSQRESNNEFLAAKHTFLNCVAAEDSEWTFVVNLIKDITKELNNKTNDVLEEIQAALEDLWGNDTQNWKEVDLLDVCLVMMSRIVSRVYVGLPLCRDPAYLASSTRFAKFILVEALLAQLTPNPLRPLLGPLLAQYDWIQFKRMDRCVNPVIRERASRSSPMAMAEGKQDPDAENDLLSRLMREGYRRNEDPCRSQSHSTKLLAILNWAAIQVQGITIENTLIDIAHAPNSAEIQNQLREEAAAADGAESSVRWTRSEVAKLPKMDSVLTESLRLWGFAHGVIKVVVAKEGVDLPTGEHIPYGAKVGIGSYGVHHDEEVYPGESPFKYDPFRFVDEKDGEKTTTGLRFASTNENYLAFSHGKFSCAGRFFANHLLKLLLSQIVLRYDIKPDTKPRPQNPPSSNLEVSTTGSIANGYSLPFERERLLASSLAFLSSISDGPHHIPAIGIEEAPKAGHLSVLIAVNKASPDDGEHILQELKKGFEGIFSLVSNADDNSADVEGEVFKAIVSMRSVRILCRLRLSQNYHNQKKQSISEALQIAIAHLKQIKKDDLRDDLCISDAVSFVGKAKEVVNLFDSWSKHQTHRELEELVDSIHALRRVGSIGALLDLIPNAVMVPSSRHNLRNTIKKVARYREAARVLYRTAKKFPAARAMSIHLVELPKESFDRVLIGDHRSSLQSIVSQLWGLRPDQKDLSRICGLMGTTEEHANKRIAAQTQRTLREGKIHAEVQLIYYLELKKSDTQLRPRVVCSSKDACWLCNAFILSYGKIYMPRSHGRLYPGWRLPLLPGPQFDGIWANFNLRLRNQVEESLRSFSERRKKTNYPDPNESTVSTRRWSNSTLPDMVTSETVPGMDEEKGTPATNDTGGTKLPCAEEKQLYETSEKGTAGSPEVSAAAVEADNNTALSNTSDLSSSGRPLSSNPTHDQAMTAFHELIRGESSPLQLVGALEIQVEYAGSPDAKMPNVHQKRIHCEVERLTDQEITTLQEEAKVAFVYVEALEGDVSHGTDGDGCIYIAARGTVVRISTRPLVARHEG